MEGVRLGGNDVDDATDGGGAIEVGCATAKQVDAVDGKSGDLVPVDPAAEGIVERQLIRHDERAAGSRGPKATQRDTFSRRVGRPGTRTAEQREPGHGVQPVVESKTWSLLELKRGERGNAGGRIVDVGQAAVGADGDALLHRGLGR